MNENEVDDFCDEIMESIGEKADDTSLPWETSAEIYERIASDCTMRADALRNENR